MSFLSKTTPVTWLCVREALAQEPIPIRVRMALDGEQAVQILAEPHFKPDPVILNLTLPKVFGLLVLERTRPDAPVVVFTSSANPHFRQRALELGARDYVQKPSTSQSIDRLYRRWCSGGLGRKVTSRPQRSSMGSPSRYEYERHDFWKQPSATATEVFRTSRRW